MVNSTFSVLLFLNSTSILLLYQLIWPNVWLNCNISLSFIFPSNYLLFMTFDEKLTSPSFISFPLSNYGHFYVFFPYFFFFFFFYFFFYFYPSNFLLRLFQCEESIISITSSKNKKKSRIEKRGERVGKSGVSRLQIKYEKCQVKYSEVGCVWGLVWCGVVCVVVRGWVAVMIGVRVGVRVGCGVCVGWSEVGWEVLKSRTLECMCK